MRRFLGSALLVTALLSGGAAVTASEPSATPSTPEPTPTPTPIPTPKMPLPCEWYPVDPAKPEGKWYQPVPSDECPAPFQNVKPRMTLPPTDTES